MRSLKILTVVGARPQFIKAAMVSRAIIAHNEEHPDSQIIEEIIHTGQHYDENMSDVFFRDMTIPDPVRRLDCGGKSHGAMTGQMLEAVEHEIQQRRPHWVLVYGDTNSTLAGALAAAKLHVPVAHVEAGLRSYNKRMPEEINRILTDHVADALFCPTKTAVENLKRENIADGIYHVGDIMYDAALFFGGIAERGSTTLSSLHLEPKSYYLATVHRQENVDDAERLGAVFEAFNVLATQKCPVIVPLHPRTRQQLLKNSLTWPADRVTSPDIDPSDLRTGNEHVHLISAISFFDMIVLERNARIILTDSGGVQKEAYWHCVPCVTLRDETEWIETVESHWNHLAGTDANRIVNAVKWIEANGAPGYHGSAFGNGRTAESICAVLLHQRDGGRQGQRACSHVARG